jgi:hypothetical protein
MSTAASTPASNKGSRCEITRFLLHDAPRNERLIPVFVHNVFFRWKKETTSTDVEAIHRALVTLPGLVPSIRSYTIGSNLGLSQPDVSWDFAIFAQFDDEAGWRAYVSHPEHEAVRDEIVAPHIAERATVQFVVN